MCKIPHSSNQRQAESIDTPKLKFKRRLRMELDASGTSEKAVALEARIDFGQFSRMLDATYTDALHAHHIPAFVRECGPGLMRWLAVQCGGTYQHDILPVRSDDSPLVLIGLLAHQSGHSIQHLIQDLQDGQWSPEERLAALPGLRKLHTVIETLIQDAEGSSK